MVDVLGGNSESCSEWLDDELNEMTVFVLSLGCSVPSDMLFCKSKFLSNVIYSLNVSSKQEAMYEGGEPKWRDDECVQAQLGFDEGRWCEKGVGCVKGGRSLGSILFALLALERGRCLSFLLVSPLDT